MRKRLNALVMLALLMAACTRPASTETITLPAPPGPEQWMVQIERVEIQAGVSIAVNGSAILPPDGCLRTELLENGQPVEWWPDESCVAPDPSGQWELVVPLGRAGAPNELNPQAEYEVHAWWPEAPEQVQGQRRIE